MMKDESIKYCLYRVNHILSRLTIVSLAVMGNHGGAVTMVVIGGTNRQLTSRHVATILGMSWGAFILSWLANGVYYQVLRRHLFYDN